MSYACGICAVTYCLSFWCWIPFDGPGSACCKGEMPLNYWQIYGNPPHMPDLRTSIVHSTRTSTLNGFGRNWRANNHNFIIRSKLKRRNKASSIPTFKNMSASSYFTKERFGDVGPVETMYDKHNNKIVYGHRKAKEQIQRKSSHRVYKNFGNLDTKKKMQYHSATPMRYTNSQQFEEFKKPQLRHK